MSLPLAITVEDPETGARWTYVFHRAPVILGRDPESADLVVAWPSMSKVQAEIFFDDTKITYRDLDSRNGSIVNGEPIRNDALITISESSDVVVGGRFRLTFSRSPTAVASQGISPFDPPRIQASLVSEPTTAHVGSIPPRPQIKPAESPRQPEAARPVELAPPPAVVFPRAMLPVDEPATERMTEPPRVELFESPKPAVIPVSPLSKSPTPTPLAPGDIVAHYRVERLIGRGGMGSVYEVSHLRISAKRFAMKVLSPEALEHPEAEMRFMREAEAASRLNHPHVVSVIDFGRDRGISYLVMELLEGEDLASLIARRKLSVERIADIMLAVCSGVSAAHQLGIIHRDLKPANIFLSRNEIGETVPKVLDFGISKLRMPGDTQLTQRFSLIGTPNHLSPEQVEGRPADARCDVYALGTILYELVTGRPCHKGDTLYAILRSITEADYPAPSRLCLVLPPEFEVIILKALRRNADERFSSVFELGRALVPFASPKRQNLWREFYLGFASESSWQSGKFNVGTISLSKSVDKIGLPKTELLPAEEVERMQSRYLQKEQRPVASLVPAPGMPRHPDPIPSAENPTQPERKPALVEKHRPEKKPAPVEKHRRRFLPIAIGGLIIVGIAAGLLLRASQSQKGAMAPPPASAPSRPTAEVIEEKPLLAAPKSPPMPPTPAQQVQPSKTEQRRLGPSGPRPSRSSVDHPRRINRNRNGVPILEL